MVSRILGAAWKDPDLGPLVWLAMALGARRGELCALRWQHIDVDQGVLVVRTVITQADGQMWEKDTNCITAATSPLTGSPSQS